MESVEKYESFDSMNLKESLLRGIYSYGFESPSAIQMQAIVPIIQKKDVIAQAQSGTGKTGTFVIASLENIDEKIQKLQVLIVAPTHELVDQIVKVTEAISEYMSIKCCACRGGIPISENKKNIQNGAQIIVGTPGRILDLVEKRYISAEFLHTFIIDEADEMLASGFNDQIYNIFQFISAQCQIVLLSATLPVTVLETTKKFMQDPLHILVKKDELTLEGIQQFYIAVEKNDWKLDTLCDLYETVTIAQAVIFCNTKSCVDKLAESLTNRGFSVISIHSDMTSEQRNSVMKKFQSGESRVLVSTDLLSRGIDIQQVSVVLNFDLCSNIETYIHRIGRSGRFGRKGVAINFVTNSDAYRLKDIEKYYSTVIEEMPMNISDYI